MKKSLFNRFGAAVMICMFLVMGGMVSNGWALSLPALDFQGSVYVDLDAPYTSPNPYNTVKVTSYTDKDGWDSDLAHPNDPILGQTVAGFGFLGISYNWQNDILAVDPTATANFIIGSSTDPYLTAEASNIQINKVGSREYLVSALLTGHTFYHTNDSVFMTQFKDAVGSNDRSQIVTWDVVFDLTNLPTDYDYKINVSGKLAPVPEPATILLFGAGLIGIAGIARRNMKKEDA